MVAGRLSDTIDWTCLRLYFDVGANEALVLIDIIDTAPIDDRADMGAVGG
jgi:hypothetical protein